MTVIDYFSFGLVGAGYDVVPEMHSYPNRRDLS